MYVDVSRSLEATREAAALCDAFASESRNASRYFPPASRQRDPEVGNNRHGKAFGPGRRGEQPPTAGLAPSFVIGGAFHPARTGALQARERLISSLSIETSRMSRRCEQPTPEKASGPALSSHRLAPVPLSLTTSPPHALQSLMQPDSFSHILRVLNTNVNGKEKIMYALTAIKGIGRRFSAISLKKAEVDLKKRAGELSAEELEAVMNIVANPREYKIPDWFLNRQKDIKTGTYSQLVSSQLDTKLREDLERMKKIRNHRGLRHYWGFTVRGQHTCTTGRARGR